jgi:hypothetical protein
MADGMQNKKPLVTAIINWKRHSGARVSAPRNDEPEEP